MPSQHASSWPATDERLVAEVRAGSDDAYATIVHRYREPLVGFAARLLDGSPAAAEDVVQEAFMRALPALRASDRPMALRAWLHAIVRNRAHDHRRRRPPSEDPARLQRVQAPEHADPAARAIERERLSAVVTGIGRLPERQRAALVRRTLCGAGHRELAGELGTTVPATKALLARARATLAATVAA